MDALINTNADNFFNRDDVKQKMIEVLGEQSSTFTVGLLQSVKANNRLSNANPESIFMSACVAGSLGLPICPALGYAYLVPFGGQAQLQIGYKGFIQLAIRTGEFKRIECCATYSNDTDADIYSRLTSFKPKPPNGTIDGYIAYFQLNNGYESRLFMSTKELEAHARKYSQTYKRDGKGIWKENFEAMCKKTVIKLLLSKEAPMSADSPLHKAKQVDQGVMLDVNGHSVDYIDNKDVIEQKQVVINQDQLNILSAIFFQLNSDNQNKVVKVYPDITKLEASLFEHVKNRMKSTLKNQQQEVA